nr:unnamed protein product [Spirometra erinaceieuropaei]
MASPSPLKADSKITPPVWILEVPEETITPLRRPRVFASSKRPAHVYENQSVLQYSFFRSTSFEESRKWYINEVAAQIRRGGLFEDPFFPATSCSIAPTCRTHFIWRRPSEIVSKPLFVADGISRFDVQQGELGDCWLLAAVASLSLHENLFQQVVPMGQTFTPSENGQAVSQEGAISYAGMFWFRFWRFGQWVDVVVDDRLPVKSGRLAFMHSSDNREFWSALLEKAYAKLVGSYEALRGGTTAEAMEDFTGGMTEIIDLGEKAPANLFSIMTRAQTRFSLMACAIDAQPNEVEADGPLGLILGHAYSVTDIREVTDMHSTKLRLIRCRNPWGNDREWVGPWSDKSSEWTRLSETERRRINLTFGNDGEFWMSFSDFVKYFTRLELCYLSPEFDAIPTAQTRRRRWEMTRHEGEWLRNSTAGGCRNYIETFHMNPQFRIDVEDPDETDDDPTGTIVVGLMQMGMREKLQQPHTIGYAIYEFPPSAPQDALLTRGFFMRTPSKARSPVFSNTREVCGRHKLSPGTYAIIPSTFEPNLEAKFLLRIFSEKSYNSSELDEKIAILTASLRAKLPVTETEKNLALLRSAFDAIAGPSGDITSVELRDILNEVFMNKGFKFDGFSAETARSMVALMDVDTSGTLGFDEFKKLWFELRLWQTIYKRYDPDGRGLLKSCELREVLSDTGIHVSNEVFKAIVCRYVDNGQVLFDDYILLVVRLITVFATFKERALPGRDQAAFSSSEFLRCVLYI